MNINEQMIAFIEKSPTAFHAVQTIEEELVNNGFKELKEKDTWNLVPGGKYYLTRNQSGILAFVLQKDAEFFADVLKAIYSTCSSTSAAFTAFSTSLTTNVSRSGVA